MFGLFRLLILLPLAFAAGWLYENNASAERCVDAGGVFRDGLCRGAK